MKSFIPWIGGKSLLAKKIVSMFPNDFERYIEVFGGGGSCPSQTIKLNVICVWSK